MAKIILISCVSKKLSRKSKAKDLYISPLFRYNLKYAQSLNPEKIYIISAKYGLLDLEQEIQPYDLTLNKMPSQEIKKWANNVVNQLNSKTNIKNDMFIFLAGNKYRKYLLPHITHYQIPLKGFSIGRQLKYLKEKVKNE